MNNRVINNTKWIILCKIFQSCLGLLVSMFSARYLGPSNYGLINYAASLVAFVVPIMYLGINNVLVSEMIQNKENEGQIIGTSVLISSISSIFCIIGVTAFAYIANYGKTIVVTVCFLYSLLLVFQSIEIVQYWFQAKLLSKYTSLVMLSAYVIVSIYKIILLILGKSVYWFAISNAFDYMLISVGLYFFYKKLGGQKLRFSFRIAKGLVSKGRYYIISSLMVTIFAQTDKIMLGSMLGQDYVGYYSAATVCAGMTSFVFTAIIDSMRPVIFESKHLENGLFENNMIKLYSVIIYISLLQSLIVTLFAKYIILILYGTEYMQAVSALRLVVWYTTFSYLGSVRNIWILARNKQNLLWIINLSGACLNVLLNYILIPIWGICGASLASLITQFFTNFIIGYIMIPISENNKLMCKALNLRYIICFVRNVFNK